MTEFNPNYAPEGMIAVKVNYENGTTCKTCAYYQQKMCSDKPCCAHERADKATVIFIKKEHDEVAVLSG